MMRNVIAAVGIVVSQAGAISPALAQANTPPTADDIQWTMYAPCQTLQFDLTGYTDDADGDPIQIVSTTNGSQGITWSEGLIVHYQPGTAWSDTDSFTYTIEDLHGAQATGTVTIYFEDRNC